MISRRRRSLAVLAVLVTTLAATLGLGTATAPTAAAQPAGPIVLTGVTADEAGVTLELTVTNTTDSPLYSAEVLFWVDREGASDEAGYRQLLERDPNANTGVRLGWPDQLDAYAVLSAGYDTFGPGESRHVTLFAAWSDLALSAPGVYLIGAHLHAATAAGAGGQVIARARTLLTVPGDTTAERVTVVTLTSAPSLLYDDVFADDHLAQEFAARGEETAGGRLTELALAAARPGATWVIDPALYHAATVMAGGYQVDTGGQLVPGTGTLAAAAWLELVDSLPHSNGYRTLWGDPDLVLADDLDDGAIITRSLEAWDEAKSGYRTIATLPLAFIPQSGALGAGVWDLLPADAIPAAVFGSAEGAPQAVLVLPVQSDAYPAGPGPDPATTALQLRQRAAAADYIAARSGRAGVRVLRTAEDAAITLGEPPDWIRSVAAAQATPPTAIPQASPAAVLAAGAAAAAARAEAAVGVYAALVQAGPGDDPDPLAAAIAVTTSQDWPDSQAAEAFAGKAEGQVQERFRQIAVALVENIVLTSRDTSFPVTIENELDETIYVRLAFETSSPVRLQIAYPDVIAVEAGDRVTLPITPDIRADGEVGIVARLTTADGLPLGAEARATVTINESGRLAWAIVGVSAAVVAVGTVLRVKTVQKTGRHLPKDSIEAAHD